MLSERDRLLELYRKRIAGYADIDGTLSDRWLALCRVLLTHGGELVVPPMIPESDLDLLLTVGIPHGPALASSDPGGDCHANVARLWIDDEITAVGTGYALSEGLWRQHSWGISADGTVQETKWLCEGYFGVVLPPGEPTVLFVLNNYDGDVKARLRAGGGRGDHQRAASLPTTVIRTLR
ncbi:hypothetical protein OHA72_45770 [Dactylosporangium sp. NBC_01737]|uniref:hypothetical protein n=1 Tax=Dactylosporangium sp. NBC_01737 TaxID=2975959 RepID=UPI002E0FA382|nr:hypothetical protein OHA72_45770 [Dactylosporangium sp. NBC_01737]